MPIDILPSDVGGGKNAPSMVRSPIFSSHWSQFFSTQDNSSNVEELGTMEGFFQERKKFGFGTE